MADTAPRNRNAPGIDIDKPIQFQFDDKTYSGYQGDTLASALLANGVKLLGRGFKYHRPRGVISAGSEEPNALVELGSGARLEPNTRATMIELHDGLEAKSQNRWPSLKYDISSINGLFSPLFVAGFYYKTFMWPKKGWMFYEAIIRKAAGLGKATRETDPDRYEKTNAFCDVLIVGGGVAGISAALGLAKQGKQIIIADEHPRFGGNARFEKDTSVHAWITDAMSTLDNHDNVTVLPRTTVFGAYDGGCFGAVEHVSATLDQDFLPRQRYWRIYAEQAIYATGALERPLIFGNNDLPGVMLANAAKAYLNFYGITTINHAVVFTNNDSAYSLASDLVAAGIMTSIVDSRDEHDLAHSLRVQGAQVYTNAVVSDAHGWHEVEKVTIKKQGLVFNQDCDLLAVSGGWSPTVHLQSHRGEKPAFDEELVTLNLTKLKNGISITVGASAGIWDHQDCIRSGELAAQGEDAVSLRSNSNHTQALWYVPQSKYKSMVDYQNDVALPDIQLAEREGYRSVEHLKRYTTLGMATDQGKTANINALAILAEARGITIGQAGTTTFRPPYTPVAMAAFTGRQVGHHFAPIRRTAMHDWHKKMVR